MIMYDINFPIILPRMIKDAEISFQYNEQEPLDNVAKIMETVTGNIARECIAVCTLNASHRPLCIHFIGQNIDSIHIPDIFRVAVLSGAEGVVVAHKYPENIPISTGEHCFFMKIVDASLSIDISFFDYIVVSGGTGISRSRKDPGCVLSLKNI